MKKTVIYSAIAIAFTMVIFSCKKDYTCTCTASVNVPGFGTVSADTSFTIEKVKKKDAESTCDDTEAQLKSQYQSSADGSASCSL